MQGAEGVIIQDDGEITLMLQDFLKFYRIGRCRPWSFGARSHQNLLSRRLFKQKNPFSAEYVFGWSICGALARFRKQEKQITYEKPQV